MANEKKNRANVKKKTANVQKKCATSQKTGVKLRKNHKKEYEIADFVAKRKRIWQEKCDIELDAKLVCAIADEILDSPRLRQEIIDKPHLLIECCFTIVDKNKRSVPFFLNTVQKDFIEKIETLGRSKPFYVLKGRQQGFTTVITAIQLAYAIVRKNFSGFTLADRDDNTKAIFIDKAKYIYGALPARLKPHEKFNSVNEIFFDKLNSSWRIASATSNVGRSRTLSFIHYSEVAFFRCGLADLQKSIQEAATKDALSIYETTANGFNEAKDLWDNGSCHNLFYEWWQTGEYVSDEFEYLENVDGWLKDRLKMLEGKGLSREQLCWYAKKYASYIDKTAIKQEYPCSPEEAFVSSGDCIFDKEAISNYLSNFDVKSRLGSFEYKKRLEPVYDTDGKVAGYETIIEDITFKEDQNGYISVVEEPFKEKVKGVKKEKPYVIGADTAGTGQDYFTAKVIDNVTGRCVATLRKQRIDEDLFAEQIYCLGKYYNNAFIGIETNYSRHPMRVLRQLGYTNLYVNKKITTAMDVPSDYYGFVTSSITRPIIISNLVTVMRENLMLETDRETLKEMTTFIKRDDGKAAAADGAHDDLVISSAIARYISLEYDHELKVVNENSDILKQFYENSSFENQDGYIDW